MRLPQHTVCDTSSDDSMFELSDSLEILFVPGEKVDTPRKAASTTRQRYTRGYKQIDDRGSYKIEWHGCNCKSGRHEEKIGDWRRRRSGLSEYHRSRP
eukprot:scaffold155901_cov42-Attheya_sp.AAC.2